MTACGGEPAETTHQEAKQDSTSTKSQAQDNAGADQPGPELEQPAEKPEGALAEGRTELTHKDYADVDPEFEAAEKSLSTFAIDIDTASYDYARRTIADGSLPTPETVRPEEFANAFRQNYPEPAANGFTVTADGAGFPSWSSEIAGSPAEQVRLLRIGLQTRSETASARPDAALTFVIDQSGSMAEPGRLDLVQDALHTLVDELRPTDSVAIVAYSDQARVVQPMTRISRQEDLHGAINELSADGSTNLEEGMLLGYRTAREGFREGVTNRVILLSDGLANTGNTTADAILRQVKEEAGKGIALLCVGVGSEYGDALMERLANKGDGFAVYVSEHRQARKLFVSSLPATLTVRALDAKAQVKFNPSLVSSYRLIGYENRALSDEDFRDDSVDGGEVGPGHSVTALYVVRLQDNALDEAPDAEVAEARVRWLDPFLRIPSETVGTISLGDLAGGYGTAPDRLKVAYTAAAFAEALRDRSTHLPSLLGPLARDAADLAAATEDRDVADLADMIRQASNLST